MDEKSLRDELASVVPDEATAKMHLRDAGIDATRIELGASAQTRWYNITTFARTSNKLSDLLRTLARAHPDNHTIRASLESVERANPSNQTASRVFLLGAGPRGTEIARSFRTRLLPTVLVADRELVEDDILQAGHDDSIVDRLRGHTVVVCAEAETTYRNNFHFMLGKLAGTAKRLGIVSTGATRHGVDESSRVIRMRADDHETVVLGISQIVDKPLPTVRDAIYPEKYNGWMDDLRGVRARPAHLVTHKEELEQAFQGFAASFADLRRQASVETNEALRAVVTHSLRKAARQFNGVGNAFKAPAAEYPEMLVFLQREVRARVDAIAIINHDEQFWTDRESTNILETINTVVGPNETAPRSRRVFVFSRPRELSSLLGTLSKHSTLRADVYQIGIIARDRLVSMLPVSQTRDFSIIRVGTSSLVARYEGELSETRIVFSADDLSSEAHQRVFEKIWEACMKIDPKTGANIEAHRGQLDSIFTGDTLTSYDMIHVEMSAYIPIDPYDANEEKHVHFKEMMREMVTRGVEQIRQRVVQRRPVRVLELGAGTGIFTRRLLECEEFDHIEAVEIDGTCFNKLGYKVRRAQEFEDARPPDLERRRRVFSVHNKDSRTFDPPGRFDLIFSSFADHHIRSDDKQKYFENVRRNLEIDGLFIVGDEFLKSHDPSSERERLEALERWHQYVIDVANRDGHHELAELEKMAWDSGIQRKGDFKTDRPHYEEALRGAGLRVRASVPILIGPTDFKDLVNPPTYPTDGLTVNGCVGGVYVYLIERNDSTRPPPHV